MPRSSRAQAKKLKKLEKDHEHAAKEQRKAEEAARRTELEREVWRFTAVDSLFFRESRPMDALGDAELASVFPPPAQTMMGAVRSIVGEHLEVDWAAYRGGGEERVRALIGFGDEYAQLRFNGPWISCDNQRLYPAPANLMGKWEHGKLTDIQFLQLGKPCWCDLGKKVCLPSLPDNCKGYKPLSRHWLSAAGFDKVLGGKRPRVDEIVENKSLLVEEARVGLELKDATRTAKDGQLYQTRHLRLRDGVAIELDVAGITERPEKALTRLGGEGRLAEMQVDSTPAGFPAAPRVVSGTQGLMLYVLTPVYVEPGEVLPGFTLDETGANTVWRGTVAGVKLVLRGAALDKPVREGGWDLSKNDAKRNAKSKTIGQPRPVRSLIPAGSVFYCTTDAPAGALDKLHRAYLTEQKNALGRGLLAAGVWDGLEQTSS